MKITKIDEDEDDISDLESEDSDIMASGGVKGGAVDPVLFSMINDPEKLSKTECTSICDFSTSSLEAMATSYPITLDELQNIPGVGSGKAKRYGKEFVELIKTC